MTQPSDPGGASPAEVAALRRALLLAATDGVPLSPNPRVGCVLLDGEGGTIAEGYHRGAGTPHAEVDALARAGSHARGATAVVTLEPCNHTGRTGPCSAALLAAGVRRVVFAQSDPNPAAAGGAQRLRAAGVEVVAGVLADEAEALNPAWTFAVTHGRPLVTWKVAGTLDGRIAAADGTSRWITGPAARAEVHELRAEVDAVVVGTGTVLADDPALTARRPDGTLHARQPLRVVLGSRPVPEDAQVRDGAAGLLVLPRATPAQALAELAAREVRHVLLEAGPGLSTAFLSAGLVDAVRWYVAPKLLGAGRPVVEGLDVRTITDAVGLSVVSVAQVGQDVRIDLRTGGQ